MNRNGATASCRQYCKNTDQLLPEDAPVVARRGAPPSLQAPRFQQQRGGGRQHGRKETAAEVSGPRARLYMAVDLVVAGCGGGREEVGAAEAGGHHAKDEATMRLLCRPSLPPPSRSGEDRRRGGGLLPLPTSQGGRGSVQPAQGHFKLGSGGPGYSSLFTTPLGYNANLPPPVIVKTAGKESQRGTKERDPAKILEEIQEGVCESLGPCDEGVAQAVADSWRGQEKELATIYCEIPESQDSETQEATMVRRDLAAVYKWRGSEAVTRDKALVLTSMWIVNNTKKREIRLHAEFKTFLNQHQNFKMTV